MPVLEAMAAGLAVVATACLGVDTFARHGMNALLAPPQVSTSPLLHACQLVHAKRRSKANYSNERKA